MYVLVNVQCRGVYHCKPPDHEGVARVRGVVYCHKP